MNELIEEAINTALNNPRNWKIALLVFAILVAIGLFTGLIQKIITSLFNKGEKKTRSGYDQVQKVTIIGSYNTVEGQSIDTKTQIQTKVEEKQDDKAHIQCQIENLTIDNIGEGLSFVFIGNRYFASIKEIDELCSKSKVVQNIYDLAEKQLVNLIRLFKLFNPNGITVSYSKDLRAAIAKELEYRDISLEIVITDEAAKRLPFQRLKNSHFGINNHSLGVFVNKK
ncbi:MAG: hypothetical protein ACTSQE_13925 [Candidatus Heimdallarchaeaceae archaeon]